MPPFGWLRANAPAPDPAADVLQELQIRPRRLEHVPVLAGRVPDLRIVIDHLGKPPIMARRFGAVELAACTCRSNAKCLKGIGSRCWQGRPLDGSDHRAIHQLRA